MVVKPDGLICIIKNNDYSNKRSEMINNRRMMSLSGLHRILDGSISNLIIQLSEND